jgi:hypothetical protein
MTGRKNICGCRLSLVTSRRAKTRTTRGVARRWGFCSVCTPLHIFVSPINPTASVSCRESLLSFHNLSHCSIKRHLVFSPSLRPVRPRLGRRWLRNRSAATNTKSITPTTRSLSSLSLHNHHSNNNYGGTGLLSTPIILSLLLSIGLSDDHPLLRRLRL